MAVLVPQPELGLVGRLAARDAVVRLVGQGPIVRVDEAFPRADVRLDLVVGVAEHLFPARRVVHRVGLEVPVPDAFLRAGERERQPLLALAQAVSVRLRSVMSRCVPTMRMTAPVGVPNRQARA